MKASIPTKFISTFYSQGARIYDRKKKRRTFRHTNSDTGGEAAMLSHDTLRAPRRDDGTSLTRYLPRHPRED